MFILIWSWPWSHSESASTQYWTTSHRRPSANVQNMRLSGRMYKAESNPCKITPRRHVALHAATGRSLSLRCCNCQQIPSRKESPTRWVPLCSSAISCIRLPDMSTMALASAPSTPERAAPPPGIRRSFTAPIRSTRKSIPMPEETDAGTETLYAHSACKIVSFSNPSSLIRRHSSVSNGRDEFQDQPVGTLPWASPTERTIAVGKNTTPSLRYCY